MAIILAEPTYNDRGLKLTPRVIECEVCHVLLELRSSWANQCLTEDCPAEYNGGGQRLAPREQWGYDTGEDFTHVQDPGDPFDE